MEMLPEHPPTERPPDAKALLEQYLAQCDEPCPSCGYNLRRLRGGQCPECGDRLRLHVGLVDPRRGPFVAGLIALASGAGFSGLLLLYFLVYVLLDGGRGRASPIAWLLVLEVVVSTALITIWIRCAPNLRRREISAHWGLALLCYVLPLINLLVFGYFVR